MRLARRDLGIALHVPGGMALISLVVDLAWGDGAFVLSFLITAMVSALVGQWLMITDRDVEERGSGEVVATMAFAWLIIPLIGALPFWFAPLVLGSSPTASLFSSPINGLFESFSGFTSTGLTMVSAPSDLPVALQWWRSLSEWIGGIGIALLALTLLSPASDAGDLFGAELNKPFASTIREASRWIWWLYGIVTLMAIIVFFALGMPAWEAINHGMTAVATGGFSVTDDSFSAYPYRLQGAAVLFMLAGAISFAAYHEAVRERSPLMLLRRPPVIGLLAGVVLASMVLWLSRLQFDDTEGAWVVVFQTVSALATAGFSTAELESWHASSLAVLVACMVIGGVAGATTGGIKIDRLLLILRGMGWRLRRYRLPSESDYHELDGEMHSDDEGRLRVEAAATLASVWMATLLMGCLLLAPFVEDDRSFTSIMFESASALGSVGLSTGITTAELHPSGKLVLVLLMWLGRLEIFAGLALIYLPWVAGMHRLRPSADKPGGKTGDSPNDHPKRG